MRNQTAKRIRKMIYGFDGATKVEQYLTNGKQIFADKRRHAYQIMKHLYPLFDHKHKKDFNVTSAIQASRGNVPTSPTT